MIVVTPAGTIALGTVETAPTIGIIDYSRRVTDDFGVTTVVERGFARRMSVRLAIASDQVDAVQAELARLRASVATWIADDRFNSLSFQGFLKEFSIDLPGTQISYCSLTVESLVEPPAPAEGGGDPAPAGQSSSLRLILPMAVTDATLLAASVPEADYPLWSAGTIYGVGARVIVPSTHRIYESAGEGNVGDDPAGLSSKWIDIGPTNRWAMFDQALGTATTSAGAIEVVINTGTANAIALLDLTGSTVRVVAAGYDRTVPIGAGAVTFFDLPGGAVTVTIAGDQVACGTLLVGQLMALGITEAGAGAGITDFSRKVVDDFGEVTLVERAYAKRMTANALIRTDAVDLVASRIAAVRARPSLWIGQAGVDSLTVYGLFRDFSIEVGETVSKLSLSIEGLSKAAPLADPNAPIDAVVARLAEIRADVDAIASDGVITAGREKGRLVQDYLVLLNWLSAIEARFAALGSPEDIAAARIAALAARAALDELLLSYLPAWNDLTTDTVINSGQLRATWVSTEQAIATYAAAVTGRKGDPGQDAPLVRFQWSINGVDGWHDHFFGADAFQRQSNDDGATWGPAYRVVGEAGVVGPDGTSPSIVFRRSPDQPAAPGDSTGNPPAGWSDGPPQGTEILWQSKATFRGATQLTSWSVPVRISGKDGASAPLVRTQWSINGVDGWHDNFFGADAYQRQSNDDGATWGPAYRVVGEAGTLGADGTSPSIVFTRSATVPSAPPDNSGNPPAGWSDGPPAGTEYLWQSKATFRGMMQLTSWSTPQRISGEDGENGTDGFVIEAIAPFVIPVFSSGAAKPSWTGGAGVIRLRKGGAVITIGVSYSIENAVNMAGLSLIGAEFGFAGLTGDTGSFDIVANFAGIGYRTRVEVKKVYDGSAAFRGSVALSGTVSGGVAYIGLGQTPIPGGSTVILSASCNYSEPDSNNNTAYFAGKIYLYYRNITDDGPLTLLGSVQGSTAYRINNGTLQEPDMESAGGSVSASFSFLSAETDKIYAYEARLEALGTNFQVTIGGTMKMEVVG
ncbi:hypothetical protein [Sphingomonas mucosissima]|uniref:Uncharacterized protein n=1 Tax=Sphingomonas mucosissima TaxID=370959 RepID=A0A245ZRD7_9SPHN|nr:hypothetical protein [Sphingomonas mucosissima]OWK32301.1 hypothetical protein SPMU_06230 [Sphingomonas mucosissima]